MKKAVAYLALGAAIAVATPTMAQQRGQQQVGTRFGDTGSQVDPDKARQMQKKVAQCVYDRNENEVAELLAKSDFYRIDFVELEWEADQVFDEFEVENCMDRAFRSGMYRLEMRMGFDTLRNLLAEEAYLDQHRDPLKIPAGAPEVLPNRYVGYQRHPRVEFMAKLADCVVYQGTKDAHELLDSRPGSGGEEKRVEALTPVFASCASVDDEIEMSVSLMRQIVADGLWSRAYYGPTAVAAAEPAETPAEGTTE